MAAFTAIAGTALSVIGAASQANQGRKAAGRARDAQEAARLELAAIKKRRKPITNPYANSKDLSSLATDLSGQINNPFASLGVATQAAEIQIEQADIALANTLDTLRATGASAGGATALAQAALQSKKGVSASIESQEAANEKLKAQGAQQLQQMKMAEQQRLQNISISEGQRMQAADAQGKQFMFSAEEQRINMDLNRAAGQQTQANQNLIDANTATMGGYASAIGAFGTIAAASVGKSDGTINNTYNTIAPLPPPPKTTTTEGGDDGGSEDDGSRAGGGIASDRKLKQNIKLIGKSSKDLNIYAFEYINKVFGEGTWQGVMSDEIPKYAVIKHNDGFDRVDYSKLDVTFKQI